MLRPLVLLGLVLSTGCGGGPRIAFAGLDEGSGLVRSRQHDGQFWTHNDSTDAPCPGDTRLFAMTAEGRVTQVVTVLDACNVDWEDIAVDDAGNLWVADFGNNKNDRLDLVLYRIPEPAPSAKTARPDRRVRFAYREQTEFPASPRDFDAEALFWAPHPTTGQGTLYLLTKHRDDQSTVLYRFDDLSGSEPTAPTPVGRFDLGGDPKRFGGMATAADATADGRYLAVLSYHALFVFERPAEGDDYLSRLVSRIDLDQDVTVQAEAVAWDGDALVFTNEEGRIFRVADPMVSGPYPR